jgi:membrane protein required for beta-lactamase induction
LFGVLIWFFALGPIGAVLYRCLSRLPRLLRARWPNSPAAQYTDFLHNACAWIPARITALLFSLAGSFDDAWSAWAALMREPIHGWRSHTWAVLAEVPSAALRSENREGSTIIPASLEVSLREVLRMQNRATVLLLACFVFFAAGAIL